MVVCIWKICQFHLNRKKRSVLRDMQCANLELWNSEIRCLLFMLLLWSYTIHIAVVGVFIVENVGMLHLYEFTRQLVFRLVFLFVNFRISFFLVRHRITHFSVYTLKYVWMSVNNAPNFAHLSIRIRILKEKSR